MFDRFLGVDRRLVPLITALLVAGFLATSLASYFVSRASVREGIVEGELPLTADNIYTEIQKDLLRPVFISSMMAHDTFLRDWVIGGEHDAAQIAKYLDEIKVKYDTISTFFVSDKTRTYYYSDGVLKRMSPDDWRDVWFFRVRQMTEPYEINVDPDFANQDTMTIFINFRLLDYQGKFLGAVGVGQAVNSLRKQIDRYRDRFGRDVYFVDSSGKIVLAGAGAQSPATILAKPGLAALAPRILAGSDGSFQYRNGLHTVFLNTRFIPELGWHVFVEQDETAATAGIWHTLLANLAICFVITVIVVLAVHAAIRAFQGRIHEMAITDKLTGLLNRHGFEARFAQALKGSKRSQEAVSVVLFDIDRFKDINDQFGHVVGDSCIAEVAKAARAAVGEAAAMCRWGGDEFLVLFDGAGLADASRLAEKIGDGVAARPFDHDGHPIKLTVSLGVAQQRPGEAADRLIARADAALYDAKSRGRQKVAQAS
ncbi:MAG TPA: sensor domain-containing diguanylate cyclase [Alphaproteobacteria bacterium]|nr:sensor domain-containing diguanylate cyclase [Alphaproteobacteria bacterium]